MLKKCKHVCRQYKKLPADNLLAGKIYIFSIVYLTGSGLVPRLFCSNYRLS